MRPQITELDGVLRDRNLARMAQRESARHGAIDALAMEMRLTLVAAHADFLEKIEERLREEGLSHGMFLVMTTLRDNDNAALTMGEVAKRMLTKPRNVTPLVDALCEAGLMRRQASIADRRITHISLTERGSRLLDEFLPAFFGAMEHVSRSMAAAEKLAVIHGLNSLRRSILAAGPA